MAPEPPESLVLHITGHNEAWAGRGCSREKFLLKQMQLRDAHGAVVPWCALKVCLITSFLLVLPSAVSSARRESRSL